MAQPNPKFQFNLQAGRDRMVRAGDFAELKQAVLDASPGHQVVILMGEQQLTQSAWEDDVLTAWAATQPGALSLAVQYFPSASQAGKDLSVELQELRAQLGVLQQQQQGVLQQQQQGVRLLNLSMREGLKFRGSSIGSSSVANVIDQLREDVDNFYGTQRVASDGTLERFCMVCGLWFPSTWMVTAHILPHSWWGELLMTLTNWTSENIRENTLVMCKVFEVTMDRGWWTPFVYGIDDIRFKVLKNSLSTLNVLEHLRSGNKGHAFINEEHAKLPAPAGFDLLTFDFFNGKPLTFRAGFGGRPARRAINLLGCRALLEARHERWSPGMDMSLPEAAWSDGCTMAEERVKEWLATPGVLSPRVSSSVEDGGESGEKGLVEPVKVPRRRGGKKENLRKAKAADKKAKAAGQAQGHKLGAQNG